MPWIARLLGPKDEDTAVFIMAGLKSIGIDAHVIVRLPVLHEERRIGCGATDLCGLVAHLPRHRQQPPEVREPGARVVPDDRQGGENDGVHGIEEQVVVS